MAKYDHIKIEKKWQRIWKDTELYRVDGDSKKPKFYCLDMFPYPSGAGLHVGHPKGYIATDIFSRVKTHQGYEVLHPMGWDAFGLPTENYAIKNKINPREAAAENIKRFKEQLAVLGFNYDWDREVNTTDPNFYKWTQWIFLQLFKKGLAYQSYEPINWCPSCKTGLSMEDLEGGKCERCGGDVEQRPMRQWVLKITDYADRLLEDLKLLDWEDQIVEQQRNWIGRSEGAKVKFAVEGSNEIVEVFTTRIDTLFGATFMVLAPEHPLVEKITTTVQKKAVEKYVSDTKKKTDLERQQEKKKTGAFTGAYVVNPANNEKIPVWISDYVLLGYGTGAIMAVPAHDERDHEFAEKFELPIKKVIEPRFVTKSGDNAFREDEPVVDRDVACAIVRNPKTNKYLCVSWKTAKMHGLVTGGIEKDESAVSAARREVLEETGYKNLKLLPGEEHKIHAYFYHLVKNVNRWARFHYVFFDLIDEERAEVSAEEAAIQELCWLTVAEMKKFFTVSEAEYAINIIENPQFIYTGYGFLVDSGNFSGEISEDAKEKIVAKLAKEGKAEKAVSYKLKDWVFSRQRYWGEPIPIVHCATCAGDSKQPFSISINFRDDSVWNAILEGTKTVETRFLNPEEPERYFGDVKEGDVIRLENKNTGSFLFAHVKKATSYDSLSGLFKDKDILVRALSHGGTPQTLEELENRYKKLSTSYIDKVKKSGLVAWEFELITEPVAVPESELPLTLPDVKSYEPTGTGESPLAAITDWVNTTCPECGAPAKRETDTMPQWAGSSWYYLRYIDPKNDKALVDSKKEKEWMPVDLYVGGIEHATRHLLYARFWHKFLYDIKAVSTLEPFKKLIHVGLILAEDGRKMSKRWNNVINPDDIVAEYGADAMRLYEMFMGPFIQYVAWNTQGVKGTRKFLERVNDITSENKWALDSATEVEVKLNKLIKKVESDVEDFKFNTAVAAFMEFVNVLADNKNEISKIDFEKFLILLNPFAPHLTEELWEKLGNTDSVCVAAWPKYDKKLIVDELVSVAVQVNGKVRDTLLVTADADEAAVLKLAKESVKVQKYLEGKVISKSFYVKGKIFSIVVN